jgi:hypothetical protein
MLETAAILSRPAEKRTVRKSSHAAYVSAVRQGVKSNIKPHLRGGKVAQRAIRLRFTTGGIVRLRRIQRPANCWHSSQRAATPARR